MKILYALQGTGNGHLSRARDIIPVLMKKHDVDILISGMQVDVDFDFPVKYKFQGLGFIFGANGGIDLVRTYKKNKVNVLLSEINALPVWEYDLVINDFEPVSAWACKLSNVKCVTLSHQSAVLSKHAPKPRNFDLLGKAIIKNYAPGMVEYGFHFKAYHHNIFTPVVRSQVRLHPIENKGHYTVYLPSYDDQRILKVLRQFEKTKWQVFSKHNKEIINEKNISIRPICNEEFIASMASSAGVICGAGFETPAEALFLKKKLMVIPMKGQYEQHCNAAALSEMGVPVLKNFKPDSVERIKLWMKSNPVINVDFPDITEKIINQIIKDQSTDLMGKSVVRSKMYSVELFRNMLLSKIISNF